MSTNSKIEVTLKELITGFGFLEGIWLAVGINPDAEILKAFTNILINLGVDTASVFLLQILPIITLIVTIVTIYSIGGKLGLAAVGCAFVGGLMILASPIFSVVFLLGGIVSGYLAENQ